METITPKKLKLLKPVNGFLSIFYHTRKIQEPLNIANIKSLIILEPTAIGDIIMLIPFLKVIRKNFKNAKITLVCAKHAEIILKELNLVNQFIVFNGNNSFLSLKSFLKDRKHLKKTIQKINEKEYDLAIESRGDIRYLFFMHYFHAKRKISFSYSGGECFLTDVYDMPENYKDTHIIEDKLFLLKKIGCKIDKEDYYPSLNVDLKYKREFITKNKLEKYHLIGIHPGASKLIRQFPYYNKIIENIHSKNICYLLFKGYNEDEAVKKIEDTLIELKIKYIIINESFEIYLKTIGICDIVMCNDSGAGHIASAYGVKTYVIFGPEKPSGIRPYNEKNVEYIDYQLPCKPCYKLKCPLKEQECFTKINIKKMADKINTYIQKIK